MRESEDCSFDEVDELKMEVRHKNIRLESLLTDYKRLEDRNTVLYDKNDSLKKKLEHYIALFYSTLVTSVVLLIAGLMMFGGDTARQIGLAVLATIAIVIMVCVFATLLYSAIKDSL